MKRTWRGAACAAVILAASQGQAAPAAELPGWTSDAAGVHRFLAAHGERGAVFGYTGAGLEVWAYPLQVLSGYRLRFHVAGRLEPIEAASILARVEQHPSEVVRVYVGTDFVVREHIFQARLQPGAVFTYEVEGRPDLTIEARFQPSLDLMWPGALGGQSVAWDAARSAYVEREDVHGFTAVIRSPEAIDHDSAENRTTGRADGLGLLLRPKADGEGVRRASLIVAADPAGAAATDRLAQTLAPELAALKAEAAGHDAQLLADAVQIETPDPALNRALAGAVLALDQAWVCAPTLGCGEVAGYGPSRPGRRPQYAWFFGGDGLVAVRGLLAAGEYDRAREELAFIARYQDRKTGMIWHEMPLSAPLIDMAGHFPNMFVHVDITFQYLATLAQYVTQSGDVRLLAEQRAGVEQAWRYCRSLIDPATGLPAIPAGKEGQNEQDKMRDDIALSAAWIAAADGYAALSRAAHRDAAAAEAERAAAAARRGLARTGWDAARGFWVNGHTVSGQPIVEERPGASGVLAQGVFTAAQTEAALDRLAGPDLQTDWGVRSLSAVNPRYDPNLYSAGSVWGLGTSDAAASFWAAHRPLTAWSAYQGLIGWSDLDSGGHMDEVLAGDLYHPEMESVPEQTWSSAGFLATAATGLLGLRPRPLDGRLGFAPHLPADWAGVSVRNLRLGAARLSLEVKQDQEMVSLMVKDEGAPIAIDFDPEIPLGARLVAAEVNGAPHAAAAEPNAHDQHARLSFTAGPGVTRVVLRFAGGVRLSPETTPPQPGDASRNVKVASADWAGGALSLHAFVADPGHAAVDLLTPLAVQSAEGGRLTSLGPGRWRLTLDPPAAAAKIAGYAPADATVRFAADVGSARRP